jgi:hypothetical protein
VIAMKNLQLDVLGDNEAVESAFQKNLVRIPGYENVLKDYFNNPKENQKLHLDETFHYFMLRLFHPPLPPSPISVIIFEGYFYTMSVFKDIESNDYIGFNEIIVPIHELTVKINTFPKIGIKFFHKNIPIFHKSLRITAYEVNELNYLNLIKEDIEKNITLLKEPKTTLSFLEDNIYPPDYMVNLLDDSSKDIVLKIVVRGLENRAFSVRHANIFSPLEIEKLSLSIFEETIDRFGFNDFSILDVTRSTNNSISTGTYIYEISKDKQLKLMKMPLKLIVNSFGEIYNVFDKFAYEESIKNIIKIEFDELKDFQLFGSELMENRVETIESESLYGTIDSPKILGTAFREFLFGTSYTMLKGMSSMMKQLNESVKANRVSIKTISEIKDTRSVQLIFTNQTDIEFKGISIYYDFNRKMGNVKNKEVAAFKETKVNFDITNENDITDKLKEYKIMLEEGLIDEEEYKSLKKKTLGIN